LICVDAESVTARLLPRLGRVGKLARHGWFSVQCFKVDYTRGLREVEFEFISENGRVTKFVVSENQLTFESTKLDEDSEKP
jgi:hypothetical protein